MARARKICSAPACPNLQPCPDHEREAWAGSNRRSELPRDWSSRIVPRILRRDPTCTLALSCGGLALSTEVHHRGDPLDHSEVNLGGVCKTCHRAETQRQAATARATMQP